MRIQPSRWLPAVVLVCGLGGVAPLHAQDGTDAKKPAVADAPPVEIAVVNGDPLSRETLVDVLIEARGVEVLQQLIVLQLAKQAAREQRVRVTERDVQREYQRALDRIAAEASIRGDDATEANKRRALQAVLDENRISLAEFMVGMRRNAYLRPVAEQRVRISEDTLREEFARQYGARVLVRHVQLDRTDRNKLNAVQSDIARNRPFADIAREFSVNRTTAANDGRMPMFTFKDTSIPAALREMAFSLEPGEVSAPVLTERYVHILQLEKRVPPEDVAFGAKRAEIREAVRERAVTQEMATLVKTMFDEARIVIFDPELRERYEDFLKQGARPTSSVNP